MKKYDCIIFFVFFLNNLLIAQNTFERIILQPEDQVINSVIEDDNGDFVMVGRIMNNETYNGYLIKISFNGEVIKEKIIKPNSAISCILQNIHFENDHYFLLGVSNFNDVFNLWYLRLNSKMEIENEQLLELPKDRWISYMNSIIDTDTNIVITGYTSRPDAMYNNNSDPFFYKITINGDSLNSKFYTTYHPLDRSFDIIESPDNSYYYAFLSHFSGGTWGKKLIMKRDFDVIDTHSLPLDLYDANSPIRIDDYDLMICGKRNTSDSNSYALNVITINDQTELIDYNYFKINNMREMPAYNRCISKFDENIFIGGTTNMDYSNPFFSNFDSWFHLVKTNNEITLIWEQLYGGDAYYHLYSILATRDGGCIMVGNRYDFETQMQERDIYIAKVDIDGNIVWVQEFTIGNTLLSLYPNPGHNQVFINTKFEEKIFKLLNLSGQVVLSQKLSSNQITINTEFLNPGIYLYIVSDASKKTYQSGKWVKQ